MGMNKKKISKWYDGGIAGSIAVCFTHPLDLIKVHLQTQESVATGASNMAISIVKTQGSRALYNGLTASIARQLSYTTTRFGVFEALKKRIQKSPDEPISFTQKMLLGAAGGTIGGIVGNPPDLINVRMQNDVKLPVDQRRNYKNFFDGMKRITAEEGALTLFNGVSMTIMRSVLMTVAQAAVYYQSKENLIGTGYFKDNLITHFTASFISGTVATAATQPFDVLKTRLQNAEHGQYKNFLDCAVKTAKLGPKAFYKGYIPAWTRIGPHTILLFVFIEQIQKINYYVYTKS
ncbi:Mitochondrial dicarboxylate carrier [Trichoplax sp. H2]|uniref:Mitochondrial dicarboxylate carrier n=1 Tax=Trichoplax adhaerens TaxID=10228 RepID=B3RMT8_TRIAD|nr:hypothetical protein TRIADDRAFT_52924 [Trichoplax adhaerens]EDV27332.1 hypothetical protein TRIADDRAFT_52924 [Trichoplax adhaerens]RDD43982.1 Mitochondrial dicarboxylate carrier [Trichoplax sp. H2]|eukprot:XP_002109166.1 hypothetical protein TRIADDRAFT_52924 [Trichoplax adhaerens]